MSHINRRKFIRLSCTACAAIPLATMGLPTVGEAAFTSKGLISLTKDMKAGYSTKGGYLVPKEIDELIMKKINEVSPIRRIANEKTRY